MPSQTQRSTSRQSTPPSLSLTTVTPRETIGSQPSTPLMPNDLLLFSVGPSKEPVLRSAQRDPLPDEKLEYYLTVYLTDFNIGPPSPSFASEGCPPPPHLLAFLAHVQVSYDAGYISSTPIVEEPQAGVTVSPPPTSRTASLLGPSRRPRSIFPPTTPHPIPSVGEADRKYVKSEGTPLTAGVWGDNPDEAFQLLWSRKEKAWVAVFKLVVNVGAPLPVFAPFATQL